MKAAIIVPHYCHDAQLTSFLPKLCALELPIFIIDDGSPEAVCERLRQLCADRSGITLIERTRNGGKGQASIDGMEAAAAQGFTHVLSIDADGQHDTGSVPAMLDAARREPRAMVSGLPQFGPDIPAARLHGRKITNTLVKIATGSASIRDAMCGLRVYPVQETLSLCQALGWRKYMEFDVELMVRAVWRGLPVAFVPTPVCYPEDGASHFRMVADNARLTVMHITLLLGGLLRSPILLWRAVGP